MSLSNYTIDKRVGKGQFSEVFRAKDIRSGEMVAMKKVQVLIQLLE